MGVVMFEGFENQFTMPEFVVDASSMIYTKSGRDGIGRAAENNSTSIFTTGVFIGKRLTPATDTIYGHIGSFHSNFAGQAALGGTAGHEGSTVLEIRDINGTVQLNLQLGNTGLYYLRRGAVEGGTVIAISTLGVAVAAAWHSLEFKCTLANTGGEFILKVDGVEFMNFSGDTMNTAGTSVRVGIIGCRSKQNQTAMDDLYVVDTTGVVNNSWTGEITVVGLKPNGNGAFSQLLGSDGNSTDNYLLVDETPPNTTDYVGSATTNALDTYTMTNVNRVGTVLAVQTYALAQKSDTGPKSFKQVVRAASGTLMESPAQSLSTTFIYYASPIYTTNPDGLDWTVARVDEVEFGFRVV